MLRKCMLTIAETSYSGQNKVMQVANESQPQIPNSQFSEL